MVLELEGMDRQLVLLALAVLSIESPGFDYALNEVAKRIDNVEDGRALTYDRLRVCRAKPDPPPCHHPLQLAALDNLGED